MTLQEAKIKADLYAMDKAYEYNLRLSYYEKMDPSEQQAQQEVYQQAYQDKLQELLQKVSSNDNN